MEDFIKNELVCLRATEPVGSDRYNEISKAIQWVTEHGDKEERHEEPKKHNYAKTLIRWKDSGTVEDVVFKLSHDTLESEIGKIFYHCKDEAEYKNLIGYNNGKNYEIIGCTMYTETL